MRYKALEQALFVGAGRFLVTDNGLDVEYRISQVCRGQGLEAGEGDGQGHEGSGVPG